jgi:nucleotide-binding universal stress UspA family protein
MEFTRILVPLNGSELSERALPVALALAQAFHAEVVLLRVLDIPMPTATRLHLADQAAWIKECRDRALQEAQDYLQTLEASVGERGFSVRALLRETSPAEDILDVAQTEDVDLIVMTTHGRTGGLVRWTFGSMADKVVHHSTCPVLLIRIQPGMVRPS